MKLENFPLWTALVTPFKPGLQVDYESLATLIHEQNEAENGLLILGSTGEALNIDLDTRKNIVEFALKTATSPIMIGVGGHDLKAQTEWVEWLEQKNISAYLMVTPIYSKANDEGQYLWFKALMDKVSKPTMLYNVPSRAGSWLSLKAVKKLSQHKNYWGIKEAGGCTKRMHDYLVASDQKPIFCGDDGLLPDFVNTGAIGLISVASNVWPKQTNLYVEKCLKKDFKDQALWSNAANSLFCVSNPIPAKALLFNQKRIQHETMMPPLFEGDMQNISQIINHDKKINEWFKTNA